MFENLLDELSKTKRLEYELIKKIKEGNYKPHQTFFSEREIIGTYNLNRNTIRQALRNLVEDGYLYRLNGKGTFIAPQPKQAQIIVISNYGDDIFRKARYSTAEFVGSISQLFKQDSLPYIMINLQPDEYLANVQDIDFIYKRASGIIFYLDFSPLEKTQRILDEKGIPYIFYGADMNVGKGYQGNRYVYNQTDVVNKALTYLYKKGHRKIGLVYNLDCDARLQRYNLYHEWMKNKDLSLPETYLIQIDYQSTNYIKTKYQRFFEQIEQNPPNHELTAFLCVDDNVAMHFVNSLLRLGYKVPEDFAVIGISNYPFCTDVIIPLASVEIPFCEDAKRLLTEFIQSIEHQTPGPLVLNSKLKIIERESTLADRQS